MQVAPRGRQRSPLFGVGVNLKDEGLNLLTGGDNPFVGSSSTKIRLLYLKQNPWNLLLQTQAGMWVKNTGPQVWPLRSLAEYF